MQRNMKQNGSKTYRNLRFACCFAGIGMLVSPLGMAQELAGSNEPKPYKTPTSSYGDDRLEQELAGLADGSGVPLSTLQALHAVPLLMPCSCILQEIPEFLCCSTLPIY